MCILAPIGNDSGADFPPRSKHAHNGGLVFGARFSDPATVFIAVHESSRAADEGFVYFDFVALAAEFHERIALHRKPDAVKHEPCRFLSDAESAADFIGTDSVLAVGDHPHGDQPLVQRDRRILKDSSDLGGELPMADGRSCIATFTDWQGTQHLCAHKWGTQRHPASAAGP